MVVVVVCWVVVVLIGVVGTLTVGPKRCCHCCPRKSTSFLLAESFPTIPSLEVPWPFVQNDNTVGLHQWPEIGVLVSLTGRRILEKKDLGPQLYNSPSLSGLGSGQGGSGHF